MIENSTLLDALMALPESERFDIAMAVLDETSPAAMGADEILQEACRLQDELESGATQDLGYEEMISGVRYRPGGMGK